MKLYPITIVLLLMACILDGQADTTKAAAKVTKCMTCASSKSPCEAKTETCAAPVTEAAKPAADATTPAAGGDPPAERLIERQDEPAAPAADAAAAPAPAPAAAIVWKCLTITGKEKKDDDEKMWKGCSTGCSAGDRLKYAVDDNCVDCDTGDNCNSSVQIHPIEWIFLMTAIICAGL